MSVVFKKIKNSVYSPNAYENDGRLVDLEEGMDDEVEIIGNIETTEPRHDLSELVLTNQQRYSAVNKFPFCSVVFTFIMFCYYIFQLQFGTKNRNHPSYLILQYFDILVTTFVTILFGYPLELAHGTFKISIIIMASFFAKLIMTLSIHDYIFFDADRTQTYVLMALHYTNVFMNWEKFDRKLARFVLLGFIFAIIIGINMARQLFYSISHVGHTFGDYMIHLNGMFIGVLFGYFWIYTKKERNNINVFFTISGSIIISMIFGIEITRAVQ